MFGRIGSFIGGELYGRAVTDPNYPFGMIFPTDPLHLVRHPSQIYQALCEGLLLFIILWWFSSKPRPRMAVSALFLMGYGVARFVMEFLPSAGCRPRFHLVWLDDERTNPHRSNATDRPLDDVVCLPKENL